METQPTNNMAAGISPTNREVMESYMALLEIERPAVASHCRRVARWAKELGVLSALSDHDLEELEIAAMLHDIGFMSPITGPLNIYLADRTNDEKVKRHPLLGFSLLSKIKSFERIATGILHHHEKFDGSGFPKQLRGPAIPLYSRIIAVADFFDLESHPSGTQTADLETVRKRISQQRMRSLDPDLANRLLFIVTTTDDLHRQDGKTAEIPFSALKPGMVLAQDLRSIDGTFLLKAGIRLTEPILNKAFSSSSLEWLLTTAYVDPSSMRDEPGMV
ncbi:MAG: HD domain-containing phosphohydrolase [Lentisphaerota bacterium]